MIDDKGEDSSSTFQVQPVYYGSSYSFSGRASTNPLIEENTQQTIEALDKLTYLINMVTNQASDQEQPHQLQSTISNSNNNKILYECPNFT
ncbi:34037_t:CDS:2, partial [Gigaspora margarita]